MLSRKAGRQVAGKGGRRRGRQEGEQIERWSGDGKADEEEEGGKGSVKEGKQGGTKIGCMVKIVWPVGVWAGRVHNKVKRRR